MTHTSPQRAAIAHALRNTPCEFTLAPAILTPFFLLHEDRFHDYSIVKSSMGWEVVNADARFATINVERPLSISLSLQALLRHHELHLSS